MSLLYHVNMYLEFLILACTIYILAPNQLIEVERKQAELHSQMREIEIALNDEGYSEYCASIDKKYQGLEVVTNHFIGQALNEFLKSDE